jgi:hypothetical protein
MPKFADGPTTPEHTPILVCPTCAIHTAHAMLQVGQYTCLSCQTVHPLAPLRKGYHDEPAPVFCPICRQPEGSPFWAPVNGRRQCRVCLQSIDVAAEV